MEPIFEQGKGEGIGHSIDTFLKKFIEICEDRLQNERAKAFSFIIYDFHDDVIKEILKSKGGFAKLDRLTGNKLSVFYLNSDDESVINTVNRIFLEAFQIDKTFHLPFVIFFNIEAKEIVDLEVIELEQTNPLFAFNELYEQIENYIEHLSDKSVQRISPRVNRVMKFMGKIPRIALEKLIETLISKFTELSQFG